MDQRVLCHMRRKPRMAAGAIAVSRSHLGSDGSPRLTREPNQPAIIPIHRDYPLAVHLAQIYLHHKVPPLAVFIDSPSSRPPAFAYRGYLNPIIIYLGTLQRKRADNWFVRD